MNRDEVIGRFSKRGRDTPTARPSVTAPLVDEPQWLDLSLERARDRAALDERGVATEAKARE